MNGPEATQLLRQQGFRGLVVGVTGNVLQADVDSFLRCGADAVLPKPLLMSELRASLRGLHCIQLGHSLLL
jgi:CheY-like chemotaxis protein